MNGKTTDNESADSAFDAYDQVTMRQSVPRPAAASSSVGVDDYDLPTIRESAPQSSGPKVGDKLANGRYEILSELGRGGMGVVYRCFDSVAGIEVAVKALPPELSHNSAEMEEVRDNFQLVSKLFHQNIAAYRTLERDAQTGGYYLVMELVQGEELRQWVRRTRRSKGAVTPEDAQQFLRQVADALDYAHGMMVMHRDIKPGNVMLTADGQAKVMDFGLAAQIHSSLSHVSMAYSGTSGTQSYMSPEQWRGKPQGAPADQYALAVMAYEMLSGHLPFDSQDSMVLKQAVLEESPDPIDGLSDAANAALVRALAKDSRQRFPSCREFIDALFGVAHELGGAKDRRDAGQASAASAGQGQAHAASAESDAPRDCYEDALELYLWLQENEGKAAELAGEGEPFKLLKKDFDRQYGKGKIAYTSDKNYRMAFTCFTQAKETVEKMQGELEKKREAERKEAERREKERLEAERREKERKEALLREGERRDAEMLATFGRKFSVELPGDQELSMIWVSPGSFTMGSPDGELGRDDNWNDDSAEDDEDNDAEDNDAEDNDAEDNDAEDNDAEDNDAEDDGDDENYNDESQHEVLLTNGFALGKFEVTQGQWRAVMGNNPSNFQKGDDYPVEQVSWEDALVFCGKLNEMYDGSLPAGYEFSLPTEAQWEYACRAGTTTSLNSGKNITSEEGQCANLDEVGWYYENSGTSTYPVGQKKPNAWGFHDMHGNVWEWCRDWYGQYDGDATDPQGPPDGSSRVIRGGSWSYDACYCRAAYRNCTAPSGRGDNLGFRLALVPVQ